MTAVRAIPQPETLEAEQAVLAAVLLDGDHPAVAEAAEGLRADHFARPAHRAIWTAMLELRRQGRVIDPVTLTEALRVDQCLAEVGGLDYVATLLDLVPTAAHVAHHADLVRERALERRLATAADGILAAIAQRAVTGAALAAAAERDVLAASEDVLPAAPKRLKEIVWEVTDAMERRRANPLHVLGVASGLVDLDDLTAGWRDGNLVVIAGRPSTGKSAVTLATALEAASAGTPVLFVSLEMGREELVERLLANLSGIDSLRLRRGHVRDDEWPRLARAAGLVGQLPIWIDDSPDRTVTVIRSLARRYQRQHGVRLVIVDYLQLVHPDTPRENQTQNVAAVSGALKAMARELHLPVLAACQLSRALESREDRRPRLADLRDSGAIEQDADLVVMLWWDPQTAHLTTPPLTLLLEKQRNGPTGTVKVALDKATGRVTNWRSDP